jgi:hypothetical protein
MLVFVALGKAQKKLQEQDSFRVKNKSENFAESPPSIAPKKMAGYPFIRENPGPLF